MAFVKVKKVHIDKKGNFKMCYSVSNDDRPYATGTFYADSETVEEKVLRFIEGLNDDIVLTEGCTGNVADSLGYYLACSEGQEKPLSVQNFDLPKFMEILTMYIDVPNIGFTLEIAKDITEVTEYFVNFKARSFVTKLSKDCIRGCWYVYSKKQRLRVPYGKVARIGCVGKTQQVPVDLDDLL